MQVPCEGRVCRVWVTRSPPPRGQASNGMPHVSPLLQRGGVCWPLQPIGKYKNHDNNTTDENSCENAQKIRGVGNPLHLSSGSVCGTVLCHQKGREDSGELHNQADNQPSPRGMQAAITTLTLSKVIRTGYMRKQRESTKWSGSPPHPKWMATNSPRES